MKATAAATRAPCRRPASAAAVAAVTDRATVVAKTDIPSASAVRALQARANYWDAYEVDVPGRAPSALHAYLAFAQRTPKWIDFLMALRNGAVRLLGLKDVGNLADVPPPSAASTLKPGDRVGIFTIRSVCDDEAVLEIIDSHLDVVLSVYRHDGVPQRLTVSTLVFYHNAVGRLYMLPVGPMHRLVVRSILSGPPVQMAT
jgi:hypothetical protein